MLVALGVRAAVRADRAARGDGGRPPSLRLLIASSRRRARALGGDGVQPLRRPRDRRAEPAHRSREIPRGRDLRATRWRWPSCARPASSPSRSTLGPLCSASRFPVLACCSATATPSASPRPRHLWLGLALGLAPPARGSRRAARRRARPPALVLGLGVRARGSRASTSSTRARTSTSTVRRAALAPGRRRHRSRPDAARALHVVRVAGLVAFGATARLGAGFVCLRRGGGRAARVASTACVAARDLSRVNAGVLSR